jgi:hypothetical protein
LKKKFTCECGFGTDNVYEMARHHSDEDDSILWLVKLSDKYSFNLFSFLDEVYKVVSEGDIEQAKFFLQATGMAFLAAMDGDLEELVQEAIVQEELSAMDESLMRILKERK